MKKIYFLVFCLTSLMASAQTSSDTCTEASNATHITQEGTFTVNVINGSEAPLPNCTSDPVASKGEWYAYTPTNNFEVTISSDLAINGDGDTRLHIFSGPCNNLNCIIGDDDGGTYTGSNSNSRLSVVTFLASAGQTYYIAWDNRWEATGFDFELTESISNSLSFTQQSISTGGTIRAVVDMNNDSLDDIVSVVTINTTPELPPQDAIKVYDLNIQHQQSNGSFTDSDYVVGAPYSSSWSLAAGDYNADGYNDLVFGNGAGVNVVKANNNGTSYSVATSSTVPFTQRTNFVDIDGDNDLDVFICHDIAPNVYFINDNNTLNYYQSGDGDINNPISGDGLGEYASGGNYGSVWIDYDNDHDLDMFLAKCGGSEDRRKNQLFKNNGNGEYSEVAQASGLADIIQTWSGAWGDYDNDGDMDCFIGGYNGVAHKMMRNNGSSGNYTFTDITASTGLSAFTNTGVDNSPGDFNNDGFVDIFSNGNILLNNGDMTFTAILVGMPNIGAIGDLNNDGSLDVASSNNKININNGNFFNWIKINTIGVQSNINGIGARIEINSNGIGTQIRDVRSGEGFRYMSSLTTHFGLALDTTINSITIYWPSGVVDVIGNPNMNQTLSITEGQTLSVNGSINEDLTLYPNPTTGVLNIKTSLNLENTTYTIFDIKGRRIFNSEFKTNTIDVSHLSTGAYFLQIIDHGLIKTQKFIKE